MQAQAERPLAKRVGLRLRSSSSGTRRGQWGRCLERAHLERTNPRLQAFPRVGRPSPPEALEKGRRHGH